MKRILIAGKNSYIGTAFIQYAEEHYPEEFQAEAFSLRDISWQERDFAGYDAVFHVAGIAHADTGHATEEEKREYYRVNRDLVLETARKARGAGVGQFVFMSSMIIYGKTEHVTEDTIPEPENFYGDSKWQADKGVRELADGKFQVAVLRAPMIYGKGSKGNYPVLAKMAKRLPVFPRVENQRSMLYIENLCELLCCIIREGHGGIFFPQNETAIGTSQLVEMIARTCGHRICITPLLAPLAAIGKRLPGKVGALCRKAFGCSCYELDMSRAEWNYRIVDWQESVRRTESSE